MMFFLGLICIALLANCVSLKLSSFSHDKKLKLANCRFDPELCLTYACQSAQSSYSINCDVDGNKNRIFDLLKNCGAPTVDECIQEASKWGRRVKRQSNTITPANCRSKPDNCISYGCSFIEARYPIRCSNGDTKSRLRTLFLNCRAPNVDYCLTEASKWRSSPVITAITPANCRSRPDDCISYGCTYIERYPIRCADGDTRSRLKTLFLNCRAPSVDVCLTEASKWRSSVITITPANCRSRPDDCISYGCTFIERYPIRCSDGDTRSRLRTLFSNCRAPNVDSCLTDTSSWRPPYIIITPANCRSQTEQCLDYACNKVQQLHGRYCSDWSVKNYVRDQLRNCRAPTVDACLQSFPITISVPQREALVISPSICSRDPEKCMPYACDKVLKDYGRDCNSNYRFRNELRNLLQRCNSVSVDLCLINVPYEINV